MHCQGVLLGSSILISDHRRLPIHFGGRVAKPLVSPLTPVPPILNARLHVCSCCLKTEMQNLAQGWQVFAESWEKQFSTKKLFWQKKFLPPKPITETWPHFLLLQSVFTFIYLLFLKFPISHNCVCTDADTDKWLWKLSQSKIGSNRHYSVSCLDFLAKLMAIVTFGILQWQ